MEWIGWLSSAILVATLSRQVYVQWKADSNEGVSLWLYVGQMASQIGFIVYSVLVKNIVFVFTNSVLLAVSLVGLVFYWRNQRRKKSMA